MQSSQVRSEADAQAPTSSVGVAAALGSAQGVLRQYVPFPPATERSHWIPVLRSSKARLISKGQAHLGAEWADISENLYREFDVSDNRIVFENLYYARRQILNDLVLAELAEANGRFIDQITRGIDIICAEVGWQLPAHNRYVRGGEIYPFPDPERPVVDLFSAQTASQLATICALLGTMLPAKYHDKLHDEIETRILVPYLNHPFWWTGRLGGRLNNWTTWCTSSILHATFQSDRISARQRDAIAQSAAQSLDLFLADYGDDGACPEGPNYYRHAALCLFAALQCLNGASEGKLDSILAHPKLRNMAEFPLYTHLGDDRFANFGDGDSRIRGATCQMFVAGKMCKSDALRTFAAAQYARFPADTAPYDFCLRNRLTELMVADEIAAFPTNVSPVKEGFLPSLGMFTARQGGTALSIKAGANIDSHNHNDTGSLIVHHNGVPILIDVGVENYTKKTFSKDRFDIWTMQSLYHNLADFEGAQQQAGATFAARDVSWSLDETGAQFSAELSATYGPDAKLDSYRRTIRLAPHGTVTLSDSFEGARKATLNLMTCLKPTHKADCIILGDVAQLTSETAAQADIETIPITDTRLQQSWPDQIYRIRLPFDGQKIVVELSHGLTERHMQND